VKESFYRISIYLGAGIAAMILIGLYHAVLSAIFLGAAAAAVEVHELKGKTRFKIIVISLFAGIVVFPWG